MESGLGRLWPQAEAGEAAVWVAFLQIEEIALSLSESSGRGTEAVQLGEFSGIRAVLSEPSHVQSHALLSSGLFSTRWLPWPATSGFNQEPFSKCPELTPPARPVLTT